MFGKDSRDSPQNVESLRGSTPLEWAFPDSSDCPWCDNTLGVFASFDKLSSNKTDPPCECECECESNKMWSSSSS